MQPVGERKYTLISLAVPRLPSNLEETGDRAVPHWHQLRLPSSLLATPAAIIVAPTSRPSTSTLVRMLPSNSRTLPPCTAVPLLRRRISRSTASRPRSPSLAHCGERTLGASIPAILTLWPSRRMASASITQLGESPTPQRTN